MKWICEHCVSPWLKYNINIKIISSVWLSIDQMVERSVTGSSPPLEIGDFSEGNFTVVCLSLTHINNFLQQFDIIIYLFHGFF